MTKRIITIASSILVLSSLFGLIYSLDQRWAKADQVKQLELRLDQKIAADRMDRIQERMWSLEDRHGSYDRMPQSVKEEYRALQTTKTLLEKKFEEGEK